MNEDEDSDEEEEKDEEEQEELEENDGERFMAMGDDEFSIENIKMMGFIRENGGRNVAFEEENELGGHSEAAVVVVEGILFQKALARTAADHRPGVEEYYKRMSKHDLQGAEEYLGRAILADPKDGEIFS
ncbi:hypothetical protein AAG906_040752 [Vitis piasezkii]